MNLFAYRVDIRTVVRVLVKRCLQKHRKSAQLVAPVVIDTSTALVNVAIQRIMENHFSTELMQRESEEQEEALEKERTRPTLSVFLIPGMVAMPNQKNSFARFRA